MESIRIEKLIPGGQALGTLSSGKKVMLWGALPGELVLEWQVTKDKYSYCEGIATQVTDDSQSRIKPRDEAYLATSPWQIMDYSYELQQKQSLLIEIIRQQKLTDIVPSSVKTDGIDFFYRNKMEYALYYAHEDQRIYPAFRARGTHRKLPIPQSSIERPEIWQAAQKIITDMNTRGDEARKYQSLLLRCNQSGEVSGGLLENGKKHPSFANLTDTILGKEYSYSPNGFFQINLPVYEMVLQEIQTWVKCNNVLDLYAGVGTIGLSVARDKKLTLVECDKSAYREMKRNCQGTGAQPVLAKSEEVLGYIQPHQTVIIDPPRAGCLPEVIEKIKQILPEQLIYLSCNPITQMRDISMLTAVYNIKCCTPYNFFPRTPHLENLVVLERK